MAIARVQFASGTYAFSAADPAALTATWPTATAAGNNLFALVGNNLSTAGTQVITAPSGWTLVGTASLANNCSIALYEILNSASRSGAETWSCDVARALTVTILEYSTAGTLTRDVVGAGNTGTSTSPATASVTPSASRPVLRLVGITNRNNTSQTDPTNSFTQVTEVLENTGGNGANWLNTAPYERIHTSGAALTCGVTLGTSRPWAAIQVVYYETAGATEVTPVDSAHGHTSDAPAVTQVHVVTPADTAHAHASDAPAVTQVHVVAPSDSAHGHASESPAVTQAYTVTPAGTDHGHTSGQPTVGTTHSVTPAGTAHGHTANSPAITQIHVVAPDDSDHPHTSDSPIVTLGTEPDLTRTYTVPADPRTFTVPADNRTVAA